MLRNRDTEGNAASYRHRWARSSRRLAVACLALATALGIAACGGGGVEGGTSNADVQTVKLEGKPTGDLTISNWPLYIDKANGDVEGPGTTLDNFQKQTGIDVKYIEDINDNAEFFGKMQPLLAKGESGGRSIFVVTDWMAKKMYDLGYVQKLDKSGIPNVTKNLVPNLQHPTFDPERNFSVPWQSGMTGLIVRTDLAQGVNSICDLFDPKYKGKVDMLTELPDTVPLVMKCMGVNLDNATVDDWLAAIDKIKAAANSGQIRRFTGNDYARDLTSGDVDFVIGWSGDAVQLQADNPDIKFVMPKEGCMLFSDNMVIPVGAPNPTAAEAFMNYVYDPKNAVPITEYNYYVSPVSGVQPLLQKIDPTAAKSQLIFPTDSFTKTCDTAPTLTPDQLDQVTRAFDAVISG
jgi:spermidine/putrescine transport system substrate-binding protein